MFRKIKFLKQKEIWFDIRCPRRILASTCLLLYVSWFYVCYRALETKCHICFIMHDTRVQRKPIIKRSTNKLAVFDDMFSEAFILIPLLPEKMCRG
jgi:hypothetical protein